MKTAALICVAALASSAEASDFRLSWPVDCTLGETCHIQQYVDHDPGPQSRDFRCQNLTYDGHKGTDIALPSLTVMQSGVAVLAAADGVVSGLRDGMIDQYYNLDTAPDIAGRECGNGVVLRHSGGWETQYCHLKQGSLRITNGQHVTAGTPLAEIGLSGKTQFPHLHLSVRRNGAVIDPFAPTPNARPCTAASPLWEATVPYHPGGLIAAGFDISVPDYKTVKQGNTAPPNLNAQAPALVLWALAYGGRQGDQLNLQIQTPEAELLDHTETLDKNQAEFYRAAGRRLGAASWPPGAYTGTVRLIRNGQVLDETRVHIKRH